MEKQEERDEIKKVLHQLKKEEKVQTAKQSANIKQTGEKQSSLKNASRTKGSKEKEQSIQTGWKQELVLGLPAMVIDTILLYLGTYIFSLLYKAFVAYELSTGEDVLSSVIFYVSPVTGFLGILLLFILKNIYDVRFYRIQLWAKQRHQKLRRAGEWILYVFFMIVLEFVSFICFSCGLDFFDTYTFENPSFGNMAYTMLYIIIPLLYPIQAFVRWIFKKAERR